MSVIRHTDARRTETPNAVMTTLASPAQGGADLSVWRTEMQGGAKGPRHTSGTEQVWTFLTGTAAVDLGGESLELAEGDTAVLPADVPRRVTAGPDGFTAVVAARAGTVVYDVEGRDDRIVPDWVR
ncbi:cupin domain-containing protein [Actinomadura rayongensis]|uniref:Cupin domain-containing protein n=1 Tax=Actinomadura rayongensis TaxID=1429076 RepID=A0A6I4WDD2_9ACTN|nr:cupin domain-containing protein [Actinomadura rayongensis]MXQ65836.1 cupin domain-containing protein [Actinomadura rayongensis]